MSEEKKPKKRVGSWREYLDYLSNKWFLSLGGSLLLLIGGACLLLTFLFVMNLIGNRGPSLSNIFVQASAVIFCASLAGITIWGGKKSLDTVRTLPLVLPPTHQNTASLPAHDVLVRASAEPTEEAGKTLLRGAVKDGETPVDKLLRPTSRE